VATPFFSLLAFFQWGPPVLGPLNRPRFSPTYLNSASFSLLCQHPPSTFFFSLRRPCSPNGCPFLLSMAYKRSVSLTPNLPRRPVGPTCLLWSPLPFVNRWVFSAQDCLRHPKMIRSRYTFYDNEGLPLCNLGQNSYLLPPLVGSAQPAGHEWNLTPLFLFRVLWGRHGSTVLFLSPPPRLVSASFTPGTLLMGSFFF